jgi:coenzyme F420 biosynthesis associated uncharacterized protein
VIGWELAERVAAGLGSAGAGGAAGDGLPGDLEALARRAESAVVAYTALRPQAPLPAAEAVGRAEWSRANVRLLRTTLAPLEGKLDEGTGAAAGTLRSVAGGVLGAQIGGLVGYMSRRVLGQYEVALSKDEPESPPRLYLVAPNLRELAETIGAPSEHLLAWVTVHEVTHAVQFSSVPWLRPYLGGLLSELLDSTEVSVDAGSLRVPTLEDARALWERARDGGLIGAVAGPERTQLLDRVQSAMALVEGHAEHVMDAAGAPLVPGLPGLREALERRRAERTPLAAMLERLLGLELKLRQYREGKRFCDAVVERAGVAGLNRAFAAPELLPSARELVDPPAWIERTRPKQLPAAS